MYIYIYIIIYIYLSVSLFTSIKNWPHIFLCLYDSSHNHVVWDVVDNAFSDTMKNLLNECVYMMSPFMIRHYCVWIGRTVIFCRQTINYNWFLGHLKYLTWVHWEGHKAFDIVCLWNLSAPSLLVGIFQKWHLKNRICQQWWNPSFRWGYITGIVQAIIKGKVYC